MPATPPQPHGCLRHRSRLPRGQTSLAPMARDKVLPSSVIFSNHRGFLREHLSHAFRASGCVEPHACVWVLAPVTGSGHTASCYSVSYLPATRTHFLPLYPCFLLQCLPSSCYNVSCFLLYCLRSSCYNVSRFLLHCILFLQTTSLLLPTVPTPFLFPIAPLPGSSQCLMNTVGI